LAVQSQHAARKREHLDKMSEEAHGAHHGQHAAQQREHLNNMTEKLMVLFVVE